ncbi:hypothetical protein BDZ89DRAFT_1231062 [Hymenopellis radicata]|nr:hypothetical protein BDZ89DRAFT_1231062 [Hymenopellis radicata]
MGSFYLRLQTPDTVNPTFVPFTSASDSETVVLPCLDVSPKHNPILMDSECERRRRHPRRRRYPNRETHLSLSPRPRLLDLALYLARDSPSASSSATLVSSQASTIGQRLQRIRRTRWKNVFGCVTIITGSEGATEVETAMIVGCRRSLGDRRRRLLATTTRQRTQRRRESILSLRPVHLASSHRPPPSTIKSPSLKGSLGRFESSEGEFSIFMPCFSSILFGKLIPSIVVGGVANAAHVPWSVRGDDVGPRVHPGASNRRYYKPSSDDDRTNRFLDQQRCRLSSRAGSIAVIFRILPTKDDDFYARCSRRCGSAIEQSLAVGYHLRPYRQGSKVTNRIRMISDLQITNTGVFGSRLLPGTSQM